MAKIIIINYLCSMKHFVTILLALLPMQVRAQFWGRIDYPGTPVYDTVKVRVIGDVMLHKGQLEAAAVPGGFSFSPFLDKIAPDLTSADLAVANMEFSLGGKPYSGYPCFSAPDEYASYVLSCGVDVFLTANNHIMDRGRRGLERTREVYSRMPVTATWKNPSFVRARGVRLAFVNCSYGTNNPQTDVPDSLRVPLMRDRAAMLDAIASARADGADFVIAFPHWGEEYVLEHNASQREYAEFLCKAGVDAIVGAHPHCVQDFEYIGDVPVFYSLGNAVSNMSAANTQLELMVTLRFVSGTDFTLRMIEPEYEWLWCSRPGGYCDSYCVLKVKEMMGRRSEWKNPSDYDKMISTYERIIVTSRLKDLI